jgi:hypothetical protein
MEATLQERDEDHAQEVEALVGLVRSCVKSVLLLQ